MVREVCRAGPAGGSELGALWASEGTKWKRMKVPPAASESESESEVFYRVRMRSGQL